MNEAALRFSDVVLRRGDRTILNGLNVAIAPGEFVGVLGENGAGKSTLLRLALGLLAPTSGTVTIFGDRPARARGVAGYVPQRIEIDPDVPLRASDFVGLGYDGRRFGLPRPNLARKRAVADALEAVAATPLAGRPIGRLSGGEQQRLAIAQAIAGAPKVLLLDEPFANLDLTGTAEIADVLARLSRERGIAIVLVTHDPNPLLSIMNRVLYLVGGRAAIGTIAEVINEDTLSRLYDRPVDVLRVRGRVIVVAGRETPHD